MVEQGTKAKSTQSPFQLSCLCWALCWLFAFSAYAQTSPKPLVTELSGHIPDSTGALIPGAHVDLHPVAGGVDISTTADTAGRYDFTGPDAGAYIVSVSAEGFATFRSAAVTLSSGKARTLDIHMTIADQVQQV